MKCFELEFRSPSNPSDEPEVGKAGAVLGLLASFTLAVLPVLGKSEAASYGCYIAGNWKCYPIPAKCSNYGSGPIAKFQTHEACSRRESAPTATNRSVVKKPKPARPAAMP